MSGALQGRCLCGAVTVTLAGLHEPRVGACHCAMCQRWSGGVFVSLHAPAAAVMVAGEVRVFRSSPFAERAFCPDCGSHLWFRETGDPGAEFEEAEFELMPGLFAGVPSVMGLPLQGETYSDRAPAWAPFAGEHERRTAALYESQNPHVAGDQP